MIKTFCSKGLHVFTELHLDRCGEESPPLVSRHRCFVLKDFIFEMHRDPSLLYSSFFHVLSYPKPSSDASSPHRLYPLASHEVNSLLAKQGLIYVSDCIFLERHPPYMSDTITRQRSHLTRSAYNKASICHELSV